MFFNELWRRYSLTKNSRSCITRFHKGPWPEMRRWRLCPKKPCNSVSAFQFVLPSPNDVFRAEHRTMKPKNKSKGGVSSLAERTSNALFRIRELQHYRRIDRFLAKLMLAQWAIIILVLLFVVGRHGLAVPLLPTLAVIVVVVAGALLAYLVPGLPVTRHMIAAG